jgi:hypothetical protein
MFLRKTNLKPVNESSKSLQEIEDEGLSEYVKDLRRMKKQSLLVQDRFPKVSQTSLLRLTARLKCLSSCLFLEMQELLFIVRAQRALNFANETLGRPCDITKSFVDVSRT